MNNDDRSNWKRRTLRLADTAIKVFSTLTYLFLIYVTSGSAGRGPNTLGAGMHIEGLFYLLCTVGIIAVWSRQTKRIARWVTVVFNLLFVTVYTWAFIRAAIETSAAGAAIGFLAVACAIPVFNIAVVWIGAKGGLSTLLVKTRTPTSIVKVKEFNEISDQVPALTRNLAPATVEVAEPTLELKCSTCSSSLEPDYEYCPNCGHKVDSKLCSQCHKRIATDSAFCPFCGSSC